MSDETFTEAESDFYKAFVTILEHLKNRAVKAETEIRHLQRELEVRREQIEYNCLAAMNGGSRSILSEAVPEPKDQKAK